MIEEIKEEFIIIGNLNLDIIAGEINQWPQIGTEIMVSQGEIRIGGAAGNSAIVSKRLGVSPAVISAIGNDDFSKLMKYKLSELNINVDYLEEFPTKTPFSIGLTFSKNHERTFFTFLSYLLDFNLGKKEYTLKNCKNKQILLTGINLLPNLQNSKLIALLSSLKNNNNIVYLDPGHPTEGWECGYRNFINELLNYVDWFLPNENEFLNLVQEDKLEKAVRKFREQSNKINCVIKMSSKGSYLITEKYKKLIKTEPSQNVQDTIGAGDAFNAGLIVNLIYDKQNLENSINSANLVAKNWIEGKYKQYTSL